MTDICWFCKKNPADPTKTIEVPLYKVIGSITGEYISGKGTRTTYTYNPAKVYIPRCGSCKEAHVKGSKIGGRAFAIGLSVFLISVVGMAFLRSLRSLPLIIIPIIGVVGGVIIAVASMIKYNNYKRSFGIIFDTENDIKKYPEVSRLLGLGYEIGKSPTEPGYYRKI